MRCSRGGDLRNPEGPLGTQTAASAAHAPNPLRTLRAAGPQFDALVGLGRFAFERPFKAPNKRRACGAGARGDLPRQVRCKVPNGIPLERGSVRWTCQFPIDSGPRFHMHGFAERARQIRHSVAIAERYQRDEAAPGEACAELLGFLDRVGDAASGLTAQQHTRARLEWLTDNLARSLARGELGEEIPFGSILSAAKQYADVLSRYPGDAEDARTARAMLQAELLLLVEG